MSTIKKIYTNQAPEPNGHYSQGVSFQDLIITSVVLPGDLNHEQGVDLSVRTQTKRALENIKNILRAEESDLSRILRMTIYTTEMEKWNEINEAIEEMFGEHRPARGVVAVSKLHLGYRVAVDAVAVKNT